ncbi:MAG: 50S ribosomal protein L30 [Candidatus Gastranaerophilales bacterium]|nr:50S ribosomal protein L30 [Candidatus Gastranaerophilales bacterium]
MAKKTADKVKIKLTKSLIGATQTQIKVVKALGLHKTNDVVEHAPSATIMGMVNKISHMVEVVE